jgi:uncharacterized secreted protein with C-terminal beta-propeller domain
MYSLHMAQHLIGGLFLGSCLFLSSCVKEPTPRGADSKRTVNKPDSAPAARPVDSPTSLSRYRSCDELQEAVHRALSFKQKNEAKLVVERRRRTRRSKLAVGRPRGRATGRAPRSRARAAAPSRAVSKSVTAKQPPKKLEQFTNIQEVGVDEPDHVKIGPDNIYLLRGLEIQVASRTALKHRGLVRLKNITNAKKLLITAQHLFVLGDLEERICDRGRRDRIRIRKPKKRGRQGLRRLWRYLVPEAHARPVGGRIRPPRPHLVKRPPCYTRADTVVQAFKLRGDGSPEYVRSWRFKGRYMDARMTAGRIVLIFQQRLNLVPRVSAVLDNPAAFLTGAIPKKPIQLDTHNESALLSCSAIFKSNMSDQDYRVTKVVAINASELAETPKQAGFVGGGDQIYMSQENLYIAKIGKRWIPWETARDRAARARKMRDSLVITQVGFAPKSGDITILAQTDGTIRGRPKDQWAFKELTHKGSPLLAVFTTTGKMWSPDPADVTNNYLWILRRSGSELPVVAKIADIARGESIRSLRYIGDWAYAVTFKKTDPLFAIDLSDPLAPKIVGELKIPGFSTYMHPVGAGRLIGIGFDVFEDTASTSADSVKFQGIKLSLFDVSNPRDMRELDTMIFGERGSYSDVTGDHHAFFYDAKLGRLAFPLTLLKGKSKTEKWQNKRHIAFAGAVLVQIAGEKLKELAKWRHNRWIPVRCYREMQKGRWWEARTESQDINRVYRIGERYLSASRYGLKTYPVKDPQRTMQRLRFPGEFADCGIGREKND